MEIIFITLIVQLILFQLSGFLPLIINVIFPNASQTFTDNASEIIGILAYMAIFCIPAYIIRKYALDKQERNNKLYYYNATLPKKTFFITFAALGGVVLMGYFTYLFRIGLETAGIGIRDFPISIPDDIFGTALIFISSVLIPAIVEEILFRGVLLHTLLPYGQMFAIIFSSAAFSIMHCNPLQFLYAFFGGVIFSYVALKSGSIFYCIVLHFANNLISFVSLFINKYAPKEIAIAITSYIDLFFIVTGLTCFIYLAAKGFFAICEEKSPAFSPYKNMLNTYILIYILYALYLTSRWFYIL